MAQKMEELNSQAVVDLIYEVYFHVKLINYNLIQINMLDVNDIKSKWD